jgi:hypothetical protein
MPAKTIDAHIASLASPHTEIARQLRELLDARFGADIGTIWYGHPVWKNGRQPLAGLKAYNGHVTFLTRTEQGVESVKLRETGDVDVTTLGAALERVTAK